MPVNRSFSIISFILAIALCQSANLWANSNKVPKTAAIEFSKALKQYKRGNYSAAKQGFLRTIESEPISPETLALSYFHLAETSFQLKEYDFANQYAQQSVVYFKDIPKKLAGAYELLGKINFYQKAYDQAEQAFILNLHHHPKPQSKHFMFLAKTYIKGKKLAQAIDTLDQAIAQFGDIQEFHDKALTLEIKLYKYENAMDRVEYLIAQGQRPIHNLIKLGELHHHRGNIDEARQSFNKAKSLFNNLSPSKRKSPYMKELFKTIQSRMELALH